MKYFGKPQGIVCFSYVLVAAVLLLLWAITFGAFKGWNAAEDLLAWLDKRRLL